MHLACQARLIAAQDNVPVCGVCKTPYRNAVVHVGWPVPTAHGVACTLYATCAVVVVGLGCNHLVQWVPRNDVQTMLVFFGLLFVLCGVVVIGVWCARVWMPQRPWVWRRRRVVLTRAEARV